MKGFIKMIEAIIASVILLTSLSYFFSIDDLNLQWNRALLETEANDLISCMENSGLLWEYVRENNVSGMNEYIEDKLKMNIEFSINIEGIPKPIIRLGCYECSEEQVNETRQRLMPGSSEVSDYFLLDNREIQIRVNSTADLSDTYDLILFYDSVPSDLGDYLEDGGNAIYMKNLSSSQEDYFDLEWSGASNTQTNSFFNTENASFVSEKISIYFKKVPFRADDDFYIQRDRCDVSYGSDYINVSSCTSENNLEVGDIFTVNGFDIEVVDIDESADLRIIDDSYEFLLTATEENKISVDNKTIVNNTNSIAKINDLGYARTAWIIEYPVEYSDFNQLFKSLILWTSGEDFLFDWIDFRRGQRKLIPNDYETVFETSSTPQPFKVSLDVWYVFF